MPFPPHPCQCFRSPKLTHSPTTHAHIDIMSIYHLYATLIRNHRIKIVHSRIAKSLYVTSQPKPYPTEAGLVLPSVTLMYQHAIFTFTKDNLYRERLSECMPPVGSSDM